jgi:type II secretory pathway pseudopilin PulG
VKRSIFASLVIVAVAAVVAGGLYMLGSPGEERVRKMDERRLGDLQRLRLAIDLYRTRHGRLPASIDELSREAGTGIYAGDSATGQPYEYGTKGANVYELCAVFQQPSTGAAGFWSHGGGRQCFQVTARTFRP